MSARIEMDLTPLLQDRVHLHGFDCQALRGLRLLAGAVGMLPGGPRIEWWEHNNTNPARVTCVNCWYENVEVQDAYVDTPRGPAPE
jgi:Zn ribbon nucleic-acid-binding protein